MYFICFINLLVYSDFNLNFERRIFKSVNSNLKIIWISARCYPFNINYQDFFLCSCIFTIRVVRKSRISLFARSTTRYSALPHTTGISHCISRTLARWRQFPGIWLPRNWNTRNCTAFLADVTLYQLNIYVFGGALKWSFLKTA